MRMKPRVEPKRERLETFEREIGKSQLARPAGTGTKAAQGQTGRQGMWPLGTAQKITAQMPKVTSRAAPSSRIVSIALMCERPKGRRSVLERSVLSIVGTKMLAAMKRRTTPSIAKEKRFCSTQPRHST